MHLAAEGGPRDLDPIMERRNAFALDRYFSRYTNVEGPFLAGRLFVRRTVTSKDRLEQNKRKASFFSNTVPPRQMEGASFAERIDIRALYCSCLDPNVVVST